MSLPKSTERIISTISSGYTALVGITVAWSSPLLAHPGHEHVVLLPREDIVIFLTVLALIFISIPGVAIISRKIKNGLRAEKSRVLK